MCGIAGWYRRNGRAVAEAAIVAQCDTIHHRGPDDAGTLVDGDFGFGMRRLSIIDIAGGHQPMTSRDGRHHIVFNGEIYNHLELRGELAAAGETFSSHSDTETILAAYRRWGDAAWPRLEGMFAVAIWDIQSRELTLARDPIGIKPLYVTEQDGGLAFASELKALLALPQLRFDVDPRAVHDYFSFGHVRTPRSIYRQVRTLPPGHVLRLGPSGEATTHPYWQMRFRAGPAMSEAEWIEQFRDIWQRTVERHMLADVPIGSFLSGGVDSSAVTAAMARSSGKPVKAFTIGFPSPRFDETPYARQVAEHLGCEHISRIVDLKAATDILPKLQRCYDEPFADPAAVPTWYVSELAAEHVKVVLAGDGGDELFAGYKRHLSEWRMARFAGPLRAVRPLAGVLAALPATRWRYGNLLRQRLLRLRDTTLLPDGFSRFFAKTQITTPQLRKQLYTREFYDSVDGAGAFDRLRDEYFPHPENISRNGLEQFIFADATLNLPSAMLTKVDRASMAHSLEVRVPFLSHKLVDWAMTVPIEMKLKNGVGKYIVRKAAEPWLPAGVLDRGKQGFQMPLAEWFAGDFGGYARALWNGSGARDAGYLDPGAIDRVFEEHRTGQKDHSRFLYALSLFALWWNARASARL